MIFATVGSHPTFRFDRLLTALESLPAETELVVQHGPGEPPGNATRAVRWLPFDGVQDQLRAAGKVVSHAGVGTILGAVEAGHTPVVVPRLRRYGETVDDHQLELGRSLAGLGRIVLVEDVDGLAAAVGNAPACGSAPGAGENALAAAVRADLLAP